MYQKQVFGLRGCGIGLGISSGPSSGYALAMKPLGRRQRVQVAAAHA